MKRRAPLDLLVALGLLAVGGAGLACQVQSAELSTAAEADSLPPLLCPLGPHPLVFDAPGLGGSGPAN